MSSSAPTASCLHWPDDKLIGWQLFPLGRKVSKCAFFFVYFVIFWGISIACIKMAPADFLRLIKDHRENEKSVFWQNPHQFIVFQQEKGQDLTLLSLNWGSLPQSSSGAVFYFKKSSITLLPLNNIEINVCIFLVQTEYLLSSDLEKSMPSSTWNPFLLSYVGGMSWKHS